MRKAKKARPANNVFILVQLDFPLVEFVNLLYIYISLCQVIQDLNKKIHDANSKKLSTTSWPLAQ